MGAGRKGKRRKNTQDNIPYNTVHIAGCLIKLKTFDHVQTHSKGQILTEQQSRPGITPSPVLPAAEQLSMHRALTLGTAVPHHHAQPGTHNGCCSHEGSALTVVSHFCTLSAYFTAAVVLLLPLVSPSPTFTPHLFICWHDRKSRATSYCRASLCY